MKDRTAYKHQMLKIIRAALVNTRARHPTCRGPYVISDEELDKAIESSTRLLANYEAALEAAGKASE